MCLKSIKLVVVICIDIRGILSGWATWTGAMQGRQQLSQISGMDNSALCATSSTSITNTTSTLLNSSSMRYPDRRRRLRGRQAVFVNKSRLRRSKDKSRTPAIHHLRQNYLPENPQPDFYQSCRWLLGGIDLSWIC